MVDIIQVDRYYLASISAPLIRIYQEIFAEPPEYQLWCNEELKQIFSKYVDNGYLFVALDDFHCPIGFSAIVPVGMAHIWGSTVSDGNSEYSLDQHFLQAKFGIDAKLVWYVADLGVTRGDRHLGLGTQLMGAALKNREPALVRVSLCRERAIALYEKLGFKPMGLFQKANYKQQDGSIKSFEKMLMVSGFGKSLKTN